MPTPVISVIVPVYNAGQYLSLAIDSILQQSFGDFELLAVNDGSTDDSAKILERYSAKDPRVIVISRPNTGIVGALNDGLSAARGEFIARMDADDIIMPGRFQRQLRFLQENPDHVAVGSQVMLMDQQGELICVKKDTAFSHEEIDRAHLNFGWPIVHAATMLRKQAVDAIGGYRTKYQWLEDLDLFLRLAEIGKLGNVPEILFLYRQNFQSICHLHSAEQARLRRVLYEDTLERRSKALIAPLTPHLTQAALEQHSRSAVESRQRKNLHLQWAWWAMNAGFIRTARKHAARRLKAAPLSIDSWRLAFCTVRGR